MGFKAAVTAFLLLLGVTYGKVDVSITGAWKQNVGWELTCSWTLNDRPLQSVRLYREDMQFYVYRPERHGVSYHVEINAIDDSRMNIECHDNGSTGKCELTLELLIAPMFNTTYKCEVSEERPRFEIQAAEYVVEVFVPPSDPKVEVLPKNSLNNVNCSSAGIPAPRLVWRIGDQRIPENFSNRHWDSKTKLWNSWSVVTLSQEVSLTLTCEIHYARGGIAIKGQSVVVAISSANSYMGQIAVLLVSFFIALLR